MDDVEDCDGGASEGLRIAITLVLGSLAWGSHCEKTHNEQVDRRVVRS
jgi:hypothetical protein